jgi:hypothetical protein
MDANVYQHFRADERSFIDSVGDWIEQVQSQYAPYLTDFLDPRQSYILETLIRLKIDIQVVGSTDDVELDEYLGWKTIFSILVIHHFLDVRSLDCIFWNKFDNMARPRRCRDRLSLP